MAVELTDLARKLADAKTFVTITTINADGSPQSTLVWVKRDGNDLLVSATTGRQKTKNIERDPRVSVFLFNPESPFEEATEVRGTATLTKEGGQELIDDLAEKYLGQRPYPWAQPGDVRVVVRITPTKVAR